MQVSLHGDYHACHFHFSHAFPLDSPDRERALLQEEVRRLEGNLAAVTKREQDALAKLNHALALAQDTHAHTAKVHSKPTRITFIRDLSLNLCYYHFVLFLLVGLKKKNIFPFLFFFAEIHSEQHIPLRGPPARFPVSRVRLIWRSLWQIIYKTDHECLRQRGSLWR